MSQEFSFMNEKIKNKPFYKRKWVKITAAVVGAAVLFGMVSSVIFVKMCSWMEARREQQAIQDIEIPEDIQEELQNPENEKTVQSETLTEPVIIEQVLTLENYGQLFEELQELADEVRKGIVVVTALHHDIDWFQEDYQSRGQTSGMIIGDNGVELLILTQYDVVKQCDGIRVTFQDDTDVSAVLKKYDITTGFAVLSVNLSDISEKTNEVIQKASLGNSVNLKAGTPVMAVGIADGSEEFIKLGALTVTDFSQSAVDAEYTMLVTDMVKNVGTNGVLVNLKGEVVGVIREQDAESPAQNVLVAYGISDIKNLMEHLSNNQDIAYFGIKGIAVTEEAKKTGVPEGIYVTEVQMDSPAMLGGIQSGDVISSINGQEVSSMKEFSKVLQRLSNKQNISLEGQRITKDGYKKISYQASLSVLE